MERELSDEEKQIHKLFIETMKLGFADGLRNALERERPDESREARQRLWKDWVQTICALANQQYASGFASGLIAAGRHDLIALQPDIEKAATVIMAEDLIREADNDS